jgi:predicted PurR-regulated permease PerM
MRLPAIRAFAVTVATLIGLYICFLLAVPFLAALTGALTVAVLAVPLQRRLERGLRRPSLAAGISTALLALIVVLPLGLLTHQLAGEVGTGAAAVQQQVMNGGLQRNLQALPLVGWIADLFGGQLDVRSIFSTLSGWLTNLGGYMVQGSLSYLITILLTFYFLFYFLRDREDALRQLKIMSPLSDNETDRLLGRASDTIHAMLFGTVITAAVQGALGGLIFWLLGLPNPVFWGLVMALLAIVPVLGTFVIWIPAAIYLAAVGDWGKAMILAAWGGIVIAGVDNLLYPILAGGRLRMPTVPMFISIVGGIMLFGVSGVIIGPLAVTMTLTLLEIWRDRTDERRSAG